MAKKALKIPWNTVWRRFEKWSKEQEEARECSKCGRHKYPDWDEQRKKIKEIVEAILDERGTK